MSKHKRLLLLKSRPPSAYGLFHHCRCCLRHVYTNSLDASEFSISCTGNPFPAIPVNQLLVSAAAFLQIVQMLLVDIHGSSLKGSFFNQAFGHRKRNIKKNDQIGPWQLQFLIFRFSSQERNSSLFSASSYLVI